MNIFIVCLFIGNLILVLLYYLADLNFYLILFSLYSLAKYYHHLILLIKDIVGYITYKDSVI